MTRERALKVLLVLVGLAFIAGSYPLISSLFGRWEMPPGDQMILGIYFPIGVFLLLAVRNPWANRTLIACVGWFNLAHAAVMAVQGFQNPSQAPSSLPPLVVIAIVSAALIVLAAARPTAERAPAAAAPVPAVG